MFSREELDAALYADENGSIIGLDEVQLLDVIPERIPTLHAIATSSTDEESALEAALILASWGDDLGLSLLKQFVEHKGHGRGPWMPHRIYGYDDVYDVIARAVRLYGLSGGIASREREMYELLLGLYGECQFTTRLKDALLRLEGRPMLNSSVMAFERALEHDHIYLASQMLPVIARWSEHEFWRLADVIEGKSSEPDYRHNLIEALALLSSNRARRALDSLARSDSEVIAAEAANALATK